jgi:hypothetical protein
MQEVHAGVCGAHQTGQKWQNPYKKAYFRD